MDNLFSEDPQFRRIQYKKLSDNVRAWQQEIAAMVTEKLPKELGVDVTVVFQQVDDEKGYAVGTAIGRDTGSGKQIGVPIIVKSWHLAPIDLFFSEGKLYPINEDNLAKVFYESSLGTGVAPQHAPPNMVDDMYAEMRNPPLGGKYSYSAPFSALRLISGTLGAKDLRLFKEAAAANPNIVASYHRRGNFDLLRKYAAELPKSDQQDEINKDRALDTLTIKKDGPDNYRLYSSSDEVYDPVLITTNRRGAQRMLGLMRAELTDFEKDPMLVADKNGFCTVEAPESPHGKPVQGPTDGALGVHKNPFVFDPLQHDRTAKNIDSFGRFGVRDRDGVLAKGWVIPNVVNFDGSKASNKLFLGKALAAYQGRIAGIALADDDDTALAPDRPDTGKTGVFVYREGKDIFATVPFQVTAVTVYKNLRSLSVVDVRGKQANLIVTPNINGIVRITSDKAQQLGPLLGTKDNFFISAKMFFVRMPRMCPVSEGIDDMKRMTAEWLDVNPIKVAMQNGRYVFRSERLRKYAQDWTRKELETGLGTPGAIVGQPKKGLTPKGNANWSAQADNYVASGGNKKMFPGPPQGAKPVNPYGAKPAAKPAAPAVKPAVPSIQKVSFDFNALARHEAEFLLSSWGLPLTKCAKVLDDVKERIALEVHHLRLPLPSGVAKIASYDPRSKAADAATIASFKAPIDELFKIAAAIEDAQSVDSILSLGFVNIENVERFAAVKPMLWEVSHMLAKLLLASRLGMDDLPEESIRSALDHLQRTINGLDKLNMLREQEAKTAAVKQVPRYAGGRLVGGGRPVGFTR